MRKKLLSLLLAVCMTLSLLPGTAYASVGNLLSNSAQENQALLETLEGLTGQDGAAIQALLEQYGLLDENGNLVTDQTITLDGVEYTLEELEALLSDPATDLSQVGYVDGVPIALGDLKTILAIERELQRIQETYFSGAAFEGEALDNLNSLMAQLQSEGITLNAAAVGSTAVADVSNFSSVAYGQSYSINIQPVAVGQEVSVTVSLDPGLFKDGEVRVDLGSTISGLSEKASISLSSSNPTGVLTYKANNNDRVYGLPLRVEGTRPNTFPDYAYGELASAVQFSSAKGFVFQNGNDYSDSHTVRVTYDVTVPDLSTQWEDDSWNRGALPNGWVVDSKFEFEVLDSADRSSNPALGITNSSSGATPATVNEFIGLLQGAKGFTNADDVSSSDFVAFTITGNLEQLSKENRFARIVSPGNATGTYERNMYFLPDPEYNSEQTADRVVQDPTYGMMISLIKSGNQLEFALSATTKLGTNAIPDQVLVKEPFKQPEGLIEWEHWIQLNNCVVKLVDDGKAPGLESITAPSATYRPGQLVPVVLSFNELVYVNDDASITINGDGASGGTTLTADELNMSKAGNKLIFWYPVQKVDGAQVTITSCSGITDIFGNQAVINGETVNGPELESALPRDAATGVRASFADGQATVTLTLSGETAYKNNYANYHKPTGGEPQELPFRAVVTNSAGEVVATEQVYVNQDGVTFSTQPFAVTAQTTAQTYNVTLQVNEGTRDQQDWQDLSYRSDLQASFQVPALIPADKVMVAPETEEKNYTLSLAEEYRPTLTAKVYGPDGQTLATHQSGTWSSSDESIATVTTDPENYSGQVTLTNQKIGEVTFTFTADNGTAEDGDDKTGVSATYTVVAGDSLALLIPQGSSYIVARQNAAATVLWSSNAEFQAPDKDFVYTIDVFQGNFATEAELNGQTPVKTYTANQDQYSFQIEENVLSQLSSGGAPAYTVRVSMPHPSGESDTIRLSALAWIVVRPEPAVAQLTRPDSIYLTDTNGPVNIDWAVQNLTQGSGQTVTLTILRVTEDNTTSQVYSGTLSGTSGTYPLSLVKVADDDLRDTYQIMLSVDNPGEAPSTDSFPLYVYNGDALKIVDSQDKPISSLTLDNTDKVSSNLPTETEQILQLRQELGLLDFIGINYGDYSWNSFQDGIAWATDNDAIAVNYKQGGLYENIQNFSSPTYLPEVKMGISSVEGGTAKVTATHAATGMTAQITVTANTLRDKFYLFQVTPAVETTLRYVDGKGAERTVKTNSQGVLALYEPNGIASDVWLSSQSGDAEYMGTIYHQNLLSGERDATKLQLYPLNTFRLREAAKAEVTLVKPDGSALANTDVTIRGGVFKNGNFCETAGLGTRRDNIGAAGENQTDTTFRTDETGKLTVYFDATQFWSQGAGETEGTNLSSLDQIQYVLEIRNIVNDTYYPVFQMVSGSVSVQQEMRTASGVVVLEEVPAGEAKKPFVARQVVDYHLNDGALIDTRHSTGFVGPNYNFKEAVLTTTMLLWGESGSAETYALTMTDENGYVPKEQSCINNRYPFASMPVVESTLTLNEETMTTSGWIPQGKDVGLKTRLTQDGDLVQERTMPFRAIDLTHVTPVNEDDNVTSMLVTMQNASGWDTTSINFGNGGSSILNTLMGDLGELTGPVDTSVFKMLITPSEDPTVFNALLWAGYDSLDLKDVEYKDGVAVSANFLTKGLETDMPSVGDLQQMASGTYDPMGAYDPYRSNRLSDVAGVDFGFQLEGYYEAEIRYNRDTQKWEVFTKGGGFTTGVGIEFGFDVNAMAGPVPVTGSFELGGALQLSFQAATRYSQQAGLEWSDSSATAVTDFLTTLRLRAYVEAFGGIGFDYSLIALKIGLFGKLDVNSQNSFLSREYLADEGKQQLNGQYLDIQSEVGIKFKAVFTLITYEKVLASGSFGYGKSFNDWKEISSYWEDTGTGLNSQTLRLAAAQNGLREVSSSATLQSRDYLEQYARSWGKPFRLMDLFSLDEPSGVENLQSNANPASYPELSDDGQLLAYISDNDSGSIYDSRAHYSLRSGDSYAQSQAFPSPTDFDGYGDSDVDIAGTNSFAAAAWVRMNTQIPEKDAGDDVTAGEQNLLMNGTEIVASIYNGTSWTSTRLTTNATPDLAPAVAADGSGKAVVFWRSVYSADPENGLMDFSAQDQIMYSVYDGSDWSQPAMLFNGSGGSVKALQAAMLPDGTAMAVYTLDRTGAADGSGQEIGYTVVDQSGNLGASMLVTSDENLDENPQVIAVNFGGNDQRFVLGWHSQQDGSSDIQLLAVDKEGVMSNAFPASLSAITSSGAASVSGDFRFATLSSGYSVDDVTVIWNEQVSDETDANGLSVAAHSVLKAAKLLPDGENYRLSAPQELATLPSNNLADHFSAYVSGDNEVKAVIQATYYDNENPQTIDGVVVPSEQTMLYTASQTFAPYALEVETIGVDYENLMANSLTPIQFTVRNTGLNDLADLTVSLSKDESATLSTSLAPNESATLTVYHKIGSTVENVNYTVSGGSTQKTGTVYLDYPDMGISQMKVLEESEGRRTIAVTLYNTSDAPLAGSGRTVKLAFYTDNQMTEKANVSCTAGGVTVSENTLTISGEDALRRMDEGSFTLVLTYDVGSYVKTTLNEKEIPHSGVYLYADTWAEGTIGTQNGSKRLPEYHSSDNQSSVLLTGAYARTGEKTTLNVTQTNTDVTTAVVELKNNSLQEQTTATLAATLLDANGRPLETKTTGISGTLGGETVQTSTITFTKLGSRVVVQAAASGEDSLSFEGLPVSLSDFTLSENDTYTYAISGVSAYGTLVTAISGSNQKIVINGAEFTGSGSQYVSIGAGETTITVSMGSKTYVLRVTSTHTGGGITTYPITVESSEHGKVSCGFSGAAAGTTITLTAVPDEGYRLSSLTAADASGTAISLNSQSDGTYTFTMPASAVTVNAAFTSASQDGLPFVDVPGGSWYEDGVRYTYAHGLMSGTSATTFSPDMTTTRSMIATILWRLAGSPVVDYAMAFDDVDSGAWYAEAVRWAASEGIVAGYGNNKFGSEDPITREQMALMLYRFAQNQGYDVSVGENTNILSYTDFASLGEYAISAMQWAVGAGIISGTGDGSTLSPQGQATRAQAAVMLTKFCQQYVTW